MNAKETIEAGKLMQEFGEEWERTGIKPTWCEYKHLEEWGPIIGFPNWNWESGEYRRRPEPKLVPFTVYDITTAMQFRRKTTTDWFVPISATAAGVYLFNCGLIKYDLLLEDYECRHFNATKWQPCGKEV